MLSLLAATVMTQAPVPDLKQWGIETLEMIRRELYIPERKLYVEQAEPGKPGAQVSFNWPAGVMLSALNAGARVEPKYKEWLREYADATRSYWNMEGPTAGYDVLPVPKSKDRYYDDNAWMVLALIETHEVLGDKKYLDWAEATFKFVWSGWDEKLGGGIYWREKDKASKNTCSNGPSAFAATRLYEKTKDKDYLDKAKLIYDWTKKNLRDPEDGLYWDALSMGGKVEKTKWSYNTALMLKAGEALFRLTGKAEYADDVRGSHRSLYKWLGVQHPESSRLTIADDAAFAHLLSEAVLATGYLTKDWDYKSSISRVLQSLHEDNRDKLGHYGKRWEDYGRTPWKTVRLIDQASAARAFFMAALMSN